MIDRFHKMMMVMLVVMLMMLIVVAMILLTLSGSHQDFSSPFCYSSSTPRRNASIFDAGFGKGERGRGGGGGMITIPDMRCSG